MTFGWIPWEGGPAPIPLEARCKVITRGDGILDGYAIDKGWFHQGWSDDVLAYRLDQPETAQ